jgi:hypothetical protein
MSANNNFHYDIKYNYYLNKPLRTYFGVGLASYRYDFFTAFNNYNQVIDDVDPSGASYKRTISINNFSENYSSNFLNIPFSIGLDFELEEFLNLKFKKLNNYHLLFNLQYMSSPMINLSGSSSRFANINYSGYYADLFNISISENGVYDFGNFNVNNPHENDVNFNNNWSHSLSFGFKNYFNRISISANFCFSWVQNNIFKYSSFDSLSTNSNNLNSYYSSVESSDMNMLSVNFKLGYVLTKKDEKF